MTHQDDMLNEHNDLPEAEAGASEASEDALDAASEEAADEASEGSAEEVSDAEDAADEDVTEEASDADSPCEDTANGSEDADSPGEDSAGESGDADPAGEDAADAQSDAEPLESADDDAGDAEQVASEETADTESNTDEASEAATDTENDAEPLKDAADDTSDATEPTAEDTADATRNADAPASKTSAPATTPSSTTQQEPPAPPQPPSDEPVIYGLDGEKPEETRARTSRKKTWMIAGGLAAAALLAGAFMLSAQTASTPQGTSTQTVEVEVATKDEEKPAKPTRLSAERIMQMLKDLNYDHSNIGMSNDVVWLEIAEGHIDVVQVVDNDCGISPWALTDLTVERAAALAGQLANSRIKGEGDQKPFNITDLSWQVVDQNGDAYMAVTFDPGFDQVGTTKELLQQSRGYIFSDGLYFALGAETVGYEQQGGTSPTNPWGATIVPTAYLASYGDGQVEDDDEVEDEVEVEAEEEAETEE